MAWFFDVWAIRRRRVDRYQIRKKIKAGYFDIIIFGSIILHGNYLEMLDIFGDTKVIVIDGEDHPAPFPYTGNMWRYPGRRSFPKTAYNHDYFKRELNWRTLRYRWFKSINEKNLNRLIEKSAFVPINFAIPDEKILHQTPCVKTKDFMSHVVDDDLIGKSQMALHAVTYLTVKRLFSDIQTSRFGITTKKGGWDCLRHYEIAANGAVPCFKNLDLKPRFCAPHGLDHTNSIIYRDFRGSAAEDRFDGRHTMHTSAKRTLLGKKAQ